MWPLTPLLYTLHCTSTPTQGWNLPLPGQGYCLYTLSNNSAIPMPTCLSTRTKLSGILQMQIMSPHTFYRPHSLPDPFEAREVRKTKGTWEIKSPSFLCFWFKSHRVKNFNTKDPNYKTKWLHYWFCFGGFWGAGGVKKYFKQEH